MRIASATRVVARRRDAADDQPVADVVAHAHVREEGIVLEDGIDVPVEGRDAGHVSAVEANVTLGRLLEARDHAQGRRLPRPGRAEHAEEFAVGDVEIDAVDGDHLAEALHDAFEPDGRVRALGRRRRSDRRIRLDRHRTSRRTACRAARSAHGTGRSVPPALSSLQRSGVKRRSRAFRQRVRRERRDPCPLRAAGTGFGRVRRGLRYSRGHPAAARHEVPMPPSGIAAGVLAALSFGAGDFAGAVAARRAGALIVVAGAHATGLVALLIGLLVLRPPVPDLEAVLLGLAAGVAGAVGLAALYRGMSLGSMGIVASLSGAGSLAHSPHRRRRPGRVRCAAAARRCRMRRAGRRRGERRVARRDRASRAPARRGRRHRIRHVVRAPRPGGARRRSALGTGVQPRDVRDA